MKKTTLCCCRVTFSEGQPQHNPCCTRRIWHTNQMRQLQHRLGPSLQLCITRPPSAPCFCWERLATASTITVGTPKLPHYRVGSTLLTRHPPTSESNPASSQHWQQPPNSTNSWPTHHPLHQLQQPSASTFCVTFTWPGAGAVPVPWHVPLHCPRSSTALAQPAQHGRPRGGLSAQPQKPTCAYTGRHSRWASVSACSQKCAPRQVDQASHKDWRNTHKQRTGTVYTSSASAPSNRLVRPATKALR